MSLKKGNIILKQFDLFIIIKQILILVEILDQKIEQEYSVRNHI